MAGTSYRGNWTDEKLAALAPRERYKLLESVKATRIGSDDERATLVAAIIESGSLDSRTALPSDNPFLIRMHGIINTPDGRKACIAATEQGLPALAGVEPELVRQLGADYATTYMATVEAGAFVGRLMRDLNYEQAGRQAMPEGSVAKTAAVWRKRR